MQKVWMITGASRGIGAALVHAAVEAGDQVVATARSPSLIADAVFETPLVATVPLDVTEEAQAARALERALDRFGRIDVLVNSAGYSHLGAIEECSAAEVEAQFRTNVFGLLNVTRAVLPVMRAQRSGHIFNLSSIAAFDASAGASSYAASKAAVEVLTESLAKECAPLGIRVTLVVPGTFTTGFQTGSTSYAARSIDDYDQTAGMLRQAIKSGKFATGSDPAKLAGVIRLLVEAREPPRRFLAGRDALDRFEQTHGRWDADVEAWRPLSAALAPDCKGE
jgi:NAD(P)-dependent dehydrogenase (short-subunit alcohol dehydrogenase family)